uniref:NYN domain-containing protein n=1 Tax=Periophthalmus magnuspinnatus TaxID=409849 RepID=A0A3B3ZSR0_9GOBI
MGRLSLVLNFHVVVLITGDATYVDIFKEFSHMASHNPEKLKRRSVHFRHSFR